MTPPSSNTVVRAYVPLWFYALALVLIAFSIFGWNINRTAAIEGLLFFGVGGGLYIALYAFGAVSITLDADGFTQRSLWRRVRYRWAAVTPFVVVKAGGYGTTVVMFETIPPKPGGMAEAARMMTGGYSCALPRNLGRNNAALVERLNAARAAALSDVE
jgi:hypothetical protein